METSDFGLIVSLKTMGFNIKEVKNDTYDTKKRIAYFEKSSNLDEAIKKYWDGNLLVDAKKLMNKIRDVKTEMNIRNQFN